MILEALASYTFNKLFTYQLLASLIIYWTVKCIFFLRVRHRRFQLFRYYGIPGPKPRLLDGNLLTYRNGNQFEVEMLMHAKYGSIYGTFFGDEPSLIITDLDILKKIFLEENDAFRERTELYIEIPVSFGIIFAKYHRWKAMRKILSPFFSKYYFRGGLQTEFVEDTISLMIKYIESKFQESRKTYLDLYSIMKSTTLHLISAMAIKLPNVQVKESEDNVKEIDAYLASMDNGVVILAIIMPCIRKVLSFLANHLACGSVMSVISKNLNKNIDESLSELSKNKKTKYLPGDQILDTMMKLLHEGKLSRREVIGNAETLLFGGYDTTSTTITYIFWAIAKHTDVQERLRKDIIAHGVDSKYLRQVINETMRLYPTVISFTTRLATKTTVVKGQIIPQGTKVVYNAWLIYRNAKYWPNPEVFDPERFREGIDIHPCAFAPFGLGNRRCLGYQLAMLEMKMLVCDILLRYRLKLKSPINLELISCALTLTKPKDKIIVEFERLD